MSRRFVLPPTSQGRSERPSFRKPRPRRSGQGNGRSQFAEAGPSTVAEHIESTVPEGPLPTFAELGLADELLRALTAAGIEAPFPIQAATLPDALAGRDVLGRGQTGSGKTLAFGLALLSRLAGQRAKPLMPRALILVPTRELAMQVEEALTPFARSLGLSARTVVGGTSFPRQIDALRRGVDLLIATPGRLSDHVRQGTCDLSDVRFTALDEADQMADMGFMPQVRAILDLTPQDGQRMLFSATLDGDVDKLVRQYLHNPVTHSVAPPTGSVTTMEHHLLLVSADDKQNVITEVAAREGRTIMFVRTKHHVDRLAKKLRSVGVHAGALHGGKAQSARTRVLGEFRDGTTPVLIATDVAARGIHVDDVSLVVHVDPPADSKDYLHRAGRTARAGQSGVVVTMVTHDQRRAVQGLTARAGIRPESTRVTPGNEDLIRITGARVPSGEPVIEPVIPERGGRRGGPRRGGPFGSGGGRTSEFRGGRGRSERGAGGGRSEGGYRGGATAGAGAGAGAGRPRPARSY
ncbi:DEAD/DEAH box helicase [Umezawaea sp.]|uniref:DEAD/DEAH box helicase n=1 Tax=Umezawaea sp. TaxID=1955258 RepID=UPI002ED2A21F